MTAPISLTLHRGSNICVERGLFDKTGPHTYLFRHCGFNLTFSLGPVMSRCRKPLKQTYGLAVNLFERDRENVASPWGSQTQEAAPHQAITWTNLVFGTLTFSPAQFHSKYITCSWIMLEIQILSYWQIGLLAAGLQIFTIIVRGNWVNYSNWWMILW